MNKDREPIVIGSTKSNNKGIVIVIVTFLIFVLFVFFLPDIMKFISGEKEEKPIPVILDEKENTEDNEDNTPVLSDDENEYYTFDSSETMTFLDYNISNLRKANEASKYYIDFSITNKDDSVVSQVDNLFIALYNNDNTLLQYAIVENPTTEQRLPISEATFNNASKIMLVKLLKDYFTPSNLEIDASGSSKMSCSLDENTITYVFSNNMLNKVTRSYIYNYVDDVSYNNKLDELTKLNDNYKTINGINSFLSNINNTLTFTVNISYLNNNIVSGYKYFYNKDETSNVIKFEMEARNYSCK